MYRLQYGYEYNTSDHFEPINTFIVGACYMCYHAPHESEEYKKPLKRKLYMQRYDLLMGQQINPFYYESYNAVKIEYEF